MSINKTTTNLDEIKAEAVAKLEAAEAEENVARKTELENDIEEAIAYYATISKAKVYATIKADPNPMRKAIDMFTYPTIRLNKTKDKDTKIVIRDIIDSEKDIDLLDLDKKLGGIGGDIKWKFAIQKFNRYITAATAKGIGDNIDMSNFYMKEAAEKMDMGKNPISKTQKLKTIQSIINMMLGEDYKKDPKYPKAFNCTSHDVVFLDNTYAKLGSRKTVTVATHKALTKIFMNIADRVLHGDLGYKINQKELNRKKK